MITIRKSADRGHFDHGWLSTSHTFSFADYHDPKHMGFRSLRVINQDIVQPGEGFPPHQHRNMEIITYIIEGALEHKDSMNNSSAIRKGEIQRMSAGTGVTHSEYNHSKKEPVRLLQIWMLPDRTDLTPGYEQLQTRPEYGKLVSIASMSRKEGAVLVHQDAELLLGMLKKSQQVRHEMQKGRGAWIQVVKGSVLLNNISMEEGDGASVEKEAMLEISAESAAEILVFDLG